MLCAQVRQQNEVIVLITRHIEQLDMDFSTRLWWKKWQSRNFLFFHRSISQQQLHKKEDTKQRLWGLPERVVTYRTLNRLQWQGMCQNWALLLSNVTFGCLLVFLVFTRPSSVYSKVQRCKLGQFEAISSPEEGTRLSVYPADGGPAWHVSQVMISSSPWLWRG